MPLASLLAILEVIVLVRVTVVSIEDSLIVVAVVPVTLSVTVINSSLFIASMVWHVNHSGFIACHQI